jgi:uncharacterized protein YecE (DUF72 family)
MQLSSISIGTSGYTYSWNKGKSNKFKWYVDQGFNSVEINGSFYRFPNQSWTNKWNVIPDKKFKFSIKVHRSITHYTRLKGNKSIDLWKRFKKSLEPIERKINFWLFQMPSSFVYNEENIERIKTFKSKAKLNNRAVMEFRDSSWWKKDSIAEIEKMKIAMCSVSAPGLPTKILNLNGIIYLRLHGSKSWYNYVYSQVELKRLVNRLVKTYGIEKAIYLNNDHGMLPNGRYLMNLLLKDR